jgi:polysaccharide pyruvyl transferase WcaK-like protein
MLNRRHWITAVIATLCHSASGKETKTKTIVLQSGWDTINIGDIGHTPGTLRVLEQHLPHVHIIVWMMKIDARIQAMLQRRFPNVEFLQGSLTGQSQKDRKLQKAIQSCDLFIRNSGMGQDISYMKFCRQHGKPYGLFGQSFFPTMIQGEGAQERIDLLNQAAFIYTRESKTLSILQRAGLKTPILEFGPDGCFGIDVRDEDRGSATMKKLSLEERRFITVQIRTNTPKYPGVDDPRPEKLNPLHPTPQQIEDDERRAAKYRALIKLWIEKTGGKVLIAPETLKEMGHNKRLLHDPMPPELQKQIVNLESFWNADEAASIFAKAHTVICHEPHSPIIALANGTPIIHTYSEFHSPKCWMFKDIGLSDWLLEMDETPIEDIAKTLFEIDHDYPNAQAKVKNAMNHVHQCFSTSMQRIRA